jgi:hypothetical protein
LVVDIGKESTWYLDLRTLMHMTRNPHIFNMVKKDSNFTIIKLTIGHSNAIKVNEDEFFPHVDRPHQIEDVLYVLGVIKNIIFIRAITNKGCYEVFEPSKCCMTILPKFEEGCNQGAKWCKQTIQLINNKTTQHQHTTYICNFYSKSVVTQEV